LGQVTKQFVNAMVNYDRVLPGTPITQAWGFEKVAMVHHGAVELANHRSLLFRTLQPVTFRQAVEKG
jgi:hypothetical protein